jgi:hypothetical protein
VVYNKDWVRLLVLILFEGLDDPFSLQINRPYES